MQKIACVFSFQESSWVSCQKIVFNLHKAYEGIPGIKLENFNFGADIWGGGAFDLANKIYDADPDTIVFMDHKPHPYYVLKFLLPKYEGKRKPRFIFHVFGDFTLYYADWQNLSKILVDFPVEFVVASDRQKHLIDKFLTAPQTSHICPFPVKSEEFHFQKQERVAQRKAWNVKDDEVIFTFTGRLSRQKRTHLLLKTFDETLRRGKNSKARLFIYGSPDHIGDNFLNVWENENEYFRKISRIYKSLPESSQERIHFMGNVPNAELRSVYAGADYLVNLSVHNDEDYGMSVAEAQMSGLPAILSDWGGLSSFEHASMPEATQYVRVRFGNRSKIISTADTIAAMGRSMTSHQPVDREKLIGLAREKFSIPTATQRLSRILQLPDAHFKGLSEFHSFITRRMDLNKPVYLTREQKIHPLYRKIYTSYVRNS